MLKNNNIELNEEVLERATEVLTFHDEYTLLLDSLIDRNIDLMRSSIHEIEFRRIVEKLRDKYKSTGAAQQLEEAVEECRQVMYNIFNRLLFINYPFLLLTEQGGRAAIAGGMPARSGRFQSGPTGRNGRSRQGGYSGRDRQLFSGWGGGNSRQGGYY